MPFRRIFRQLATLTTAIRDGRARLAMTSNSPVDGDRLYELIARASAEAHLVDVPLRRRPWTRTPLVVRSGEQVTWLAWGKAYLIKPLAVSVEPSLALLGRVADGTTQFSPRNTLTFTADRDGPVEMAGRFPAWMREDGTLERDRLPYWAMGGRVQAVVARWHPDDDPHAVLGSLTDRDTSNLCVTETARLANSPQPPAGWRHHPSTGAEEFCSATEDGIEVACHGTGGIIRRPAEVALTPTLRLRWSWRIDSLPTRLPEDTALTHDYVSIALEFDDGKDLTWYWSAALPEGYAYRCPMDYWRKRETHIVVRTGEAHLGDWVDEERAVLADHTFAIGGRPPARVVRAWIIACCLHQGGTARGEFRRIELLDGDRVLTLL